MTQIDLLADTAMLQLRRPDGEAALFPYLWLRDNCPSSFHPSTAERIFSARDLPADLAPRDVRADHEHLQLVWPDGHESIYPIEQLWSLRPGKGRPDPAAIPRQAWRADLGAEGLTRWSAESLMSSDATLLDWLVETKRMGVSIVTDLADNTDAGKDIARRIAFLRETNFGTTFVVESKPNPTNSAYTADALPMHTDLPNQELPPGIQFLHCLANEATGGGSILADGVAIAEDLRAADPAAFDLLCQVSVPFRYHDAEFDIRARQSVIRLDHDGAVSEVSFSQHLADIWDLEPAIMGAYYRAFGAFARAAADPAYEVTFKLGKGEMMVFDNRRILHGRTAFDPNTGYRHLHGFYVDRGEYDSRIRVLSRGVNSAG